MKGLKIAVSIMLALILALSLAACGEKKSEPQPDPQPAPEPVPETSLHIEPEDLPIIDGATAMLPYYQAMTGRLLGISDEEAAGYVLCSKTDQAYYSLSNGDVDIVFCALPSDEQVQYAKDCGVKFETVDVLSSGFVFFVNKDNPVTGLTSQQVHDIYAGKITNWKEVGGNDEEIIAYQRSEGSGSQTGLYLHVIGQDEVMDAPTEKKIGAMEGIIDAVANFKSGSGAIGYSYYYYVVNMHYDEDIRMIAIDGVIPDPDTIGSGEYPYVSRTCAVFSSEQPEGSLVRQIAQWCAGPEGKALAEELGYVPCK
ncbi:MAG: substrate-binding domain-containing protein [Firmicutes bacterium]|nr:substrate-binding domain-containing protein [Bacillota bacterium]